MRFQINMMWNKVHYRHHFILNSFLCCFSFPNHEVMDSNFTTCCEEITCREFLFIFSKFSKTKVDIIHHDVYVRTLHLYKIH
jgi:hypothetical protein